MSFIRRHIVAVFFLLTYLISWGTWFWVSSQQWGLSGWIGLAALFGAFGPSLAGLICAGIYGGWQGIRSLLKRVVAWRVHWVVYLAVFFGPLLLMLAPIWLNTLLGGPVAEWQALRHLPALLPTALQMLLIGGLTEELGWRGFALPQLHQQHGPLAASLVIGFVWAFWHLPIYTLPALGNPQPAEDLAWFLGMTPILAVFFTALAEWTGGSVWIAILFHAWMNTVNSGLPDLLGIYNHNQLRVLNLLVWLLAAGWIIWIWLRPVRSQAEATDQSHFIIPQ